MQSRITHQPTDRNKVRWKSWALLALIGFWIFSGIVGRDPWKPDEPVYIGILQSLLDAMTGLSADPSDWWRPSVVGEPLDGEIILIHWINAPLILLAQGLLPLHEAARVSSVLWAALGVASLSFAARRWSGGHISYLAAVIAIGCVGLYDRAHSYVPDITVFAAVAIGMLGCASLADAPRRATALFAVGIVAAFAARSALGFTVVALPLVVLCFVPVYSMHRVAMVRALIFGGVICALWMFAFSLRDGEGFAAWCQTSFGVKFEGRESFGPTFYLGTLLWFAWPAWPIAVWLVSLRARGFGGGWQRGEVIGPVVFLLCGYVAIAILTEPRATHTLYLLPPLIVLAAFGVDTLKRTWYALIDWFGILVLGITAVAVVLVACALYFGWPPMMADWLILTYVPGFKGNAPWLGYGVALLAFVIWIALIQPADQHARRALINWAGCVTFLWIVAQALLISPGNYIKGYRGVFTALAAHWPSAGCVNSIDMSTSQAAMLRYHANLRTEPIDSATEGACGHLLLQRYRGAPPPPPPSQYTLRFRGNRPGDNAEAFELYQKSTVTQGSEKADTP